MKDNFELCENKGRLLLLSFLKQFNNIAKVSFTTDKYNPVDVFISLKNNRKAVGEIKVRAKKYQEYYTHLIELRKLIAIEEVCK